MLLCLVASVVCYELFKRDHQFTAGLGPYPPLITGGPSIRFLILIVVRSGAQLHFIMSAIYFPTVNLARKHTKKLDEYDKFGFNMSQSQTTNQGTSN